MTETACTTGKIDLAPLVGSRLAAERSFQPVKGRVVSELVVPEAKWRAGLDPARGPKAPPYRTAAFRVAARLECQRPEATSLEASRYPETADDAFFVAGFSSGE